MRDYLLEFLMELERLVPPPPKHHHVMLHSRFGSETIPWTDELTLQVNVNGIFHAFFLQEEDFKLGAKDLAQWIKKLTEKPLPPGTQISHMSGIFTKPGDEIK